MSDRPIGYYVHHHGAGHAKRARLIAGASAGRIVMLGTDIGADGIDLADDRPESGRFDGVDGTACGPGALHYAPLDHEGIRSRVARIAGWIETQKPALMVVDVSAEVAMLARLASVPVIYVRLNGDRSDPAHLEGFRAASRLLAPFHADLETAAIPTWVRDKTSYFPGITAQPKPSRLSSERDDILVVVGGGGPEGDGEAFASAARSVPDRQWRVIGPSLFPRICPPNLQIMGWVQDPDRHIADAALVIGAAGDGLVTSVLAADRPFICIPQQRPYQEQQATAQRLAELGAAVVLVAWPTNDQWSTLIDLARALRPEARQRLHDPLGVQSAAALIQCVADEKSGAREQAA